MSTPKKWQYTSSKPNVFDSSKTKIFRFQRSLNSQNNKSIKHKAYCCDDISIRMIKICDKSLLKPLILLFKNWSQSSCYPDIWKRSNIIPAHKKSDKQLVNNYRPISLLPICGKIFKKIIFNKIYIFLLEESWRSINQLLEITHEIFEAFDCNPSLEARLVFLDISEAFDKVLHEGLPYKIKSMGILGEL